jgi:hypothetical protein
LAQVQLNIGFLTTKPLPQGDSANLQSSFGKRISENASDTPHFANNGKGTESCRNNLLSALTEPSGFGICSVEEHLTSLQLGIGPGPAQQTKHHPSHSSNSCQTTPKLPHFSDQTRNETAKFIISCGNSASCYLEKALPNTS